MSTSMLTTEIEETPLDRELQSKELARIMASVYPEPLIYLGYVVTKPHAQRRTYCLHSCEEPMLK